jgi:hypothetical protein
MNPTKLTDPTDPTDLTDPANLTASTDPTSQQTLLIQLIQLILGGGRAMNKANLDISTQTQTHYTHTHTHTYVGGGRYARNRDCHQHIRHAEQWWYHGNTTFTKDTQHPVTYAHLTVIHAQDPVTTCYICNTLSRTSNTLQHTHHTSLLPLLASTNV